jgi:RNA polymerase sigma-70 factor, ECF subfamily
MSWVSSKETDHLVDRARKGDEVALEALLNAISPSIRRFGLRMCRNEADAQDVLQETLISVTANLPQFEGRSAVTSWVFALTRTACQRRKRGKKNAPPLDDEILINHPADTPSPEQLAANHELGAALNRALDQLPEPYREVLLLRDVEGLSAEQAAASIDISVDAFKSRLHRARETMRKALMPVLEPAAPLPMAGCPEIDSLWSRKLEDELSKRDCAQIEEHVNSCPACGAICEALKKALAVCQRSASDEVRPEVQAHVKAAMRAWAMAKTPKPNPTTA